jgi:adenylate cyclase
VRVPVGTTLLEAARRARLPVAQACTGLGSCGRCGMQVLAGAEGLEAEDATEQRAKARNRIDAELRLSCLVALTGDLTVTASYW